MVETLPLATAKWVSTTLPTLVVTHGLAILAFEELRPAGRLAGVVRDEMYARTAPCRCNKVINPVLDAADHAAQTITEVLSHSEDTS